MNVQGSLFDPPTRKMKPQTEGVLRILRERGSLTSKEARELVGTDRLAARILEIRRLYGDSAVTTHWEVRHGFRYARYVWRGAA